MHNGFPRSCRCAQWRPQLLGKQLLRRLCCALRKSCSCIDEGIAPGYNSFADNSAYQIYLEDHCNVPSSFNYYHYGGPDPQRDFSVDGTSDLNYWPPLATDPNGCTGQQSLTAGNKGKTPGDDPIQGLLANPLVRQAIRLRLQRQHINAINALKTLITNNRADVELIAWALHELVANYEMLNRPTGTNILSGYLRAMLQSENNALIKRAIRQTLAPALMHEGDLNGTLAMLDETIQSHPNTSAEMIALYRKVSISLNALHNRDLAQSALQALHSRYPTSSLTELADLLMTLSEGSQMNGPTGNGVMQKSASTNADAPITYSLSQNYPNPFNPTTTIGYGLPVDGHVNLKVYDVLGREVATLVNEFAQAGYHQVIVNATNLSSGLYLYRLNAGSYTSVKKLVVLK